MDIGIYINGWGGKTEVYKDCEAYKECNEDRKEAYKIVHNLSFLRDSIITKAVSGTIIGLFGLCIIVILMIYNYAANEESLYYIFKILSLYNLSVIVMILSSYGLKKLITIQIREVLKSLNN